MTALRDALLLARDQPSPDWAAVGQPVAELLDALKPKHPAPPRAAPGEQPSSADIERVIRLCASHLLKSYTRNGFLPTHNRKYSQPQGSDPVWNNANCRNRRIFDDRTGLAAARNRKPFLLQSYRRDMGGGQFLVMEDLSAPIMVRGRHCGAFRFGLKV